jgi:hypothetical protein
MEDYYQKINESIKCQDKLIRKANQFLMEQVLAHPTTDTSSRYWPAIERRFQNLLELAEVRHDLKTSLWTHRIIDTQRSDKTLDIGTPVIVIDSERFAVVTFIDKEDQTVYLDNDESPICHLIDGQTSILRLATQEEIISAYKESDITKII